nr:hypothetical protein [Nanoarchaeota archaeon]
MKRLRQIGKKVLSTLLIPAALAGSIYLSPKKVSAQDTKPLEFKIENTIYRDKESGLVNDKIRTTLSYDRFSFRLDRNEGRQSQYMFSFKAINKDNTKLSLFHQGDIKNKDNSASYCFGGALIQNIGKLPVLGETSAKLLHLTSSKTDDKPFQKYVANLIGEHFDIAYQLKVNREREKDPQYYVAYHNKNIHASLGKTDGNKIEGIFVTKDMPGFSLVTFGNYDLDSKVLSLSSWNAFKNGSKDIYNQDIARLASNLLTLGSVEVNFPYFTSYLTQGDVTHKLDLEIGKGSFKMANQVGMKITPNLGVGAGAMIKKLKGGKLELEPVVEAFGRIPLGKNLDLHVEGAYFDGRFNGYAYIQFKK